MMDFEHYIYEDKKYILTIFNQNYQRTCLINVK